MRIEHTHTTRTASAQRRLGLMIPCALALGACLSTPESRLPDIEPICDTTSDCDTGEICDIGICWGNPPTRPFAAVLWPPLEGRTDLAPTEIVELNIASDGVVENLAFAESAAISGRVLLDCGPMPTTGECDPTRSIAARITFTRPSDIPGLPPYTRSVTSVPGRDASESSFFVALPRSEVEYQVRVVPVETISASESQGEIPPALAPPSHRTLVAARDMEVEWRMGAPDAHKTVTGRVVDLLDQGVPGMRVFAVEGQASPSPDERISSIMTTGDDGAFALRLPVEYQEPFDLVAIPRAQESTPALRAFGRRAPDLESDIGTLVMPGYGRAVTYTVPVRGIDGNGDEVPIAGATVRVTTLLGGAAEDTVATFSTLAYTDERGDVVLELLPPGNMQNRTYLMDIEPLGGSEHAILHGHGLDIGTDAGGVLEAVTLSRRIAVSGQVYTPDREPAAGSTIEARLSEAFRQRLDPDERALVDSVQLPSASTDQSGRFVLWLDEHLVGQEASYDLRLTQADPLAPLWSVRGVRMGVQTEFATVEIPEIILPSASYAHGIVRDLSGQPVPGAEIRWFELLDDTSACEGSAEQPCVSVFRGLRDADGDGWVMLVLPE